jgi:hypothetical protein
MHHHFLCFYLSTCASGRHLSPAVTQRSSVGPLPWHQAGQVRRNVHGKRVSFTCDTGYLSLKQQAGGACVQATQPYIDKIRGGGGIINRMRPFEFLLFLLYYALYGAVYNIPCVCLCMSVCSTRSRLAASSSIIQALTHEPQSRHWLHATQVMETSHLISLTYIYTILLCQTYICI